jgi:hypothetical protein
MFAEKLENPLAFYATQCRKPKSYINGERFHLQQFYWASQFAVTSDVNYAGREHAPLFLSECFTCNMLLTNDTMMHNIFPSSLSFYIPTA